MNSSESSEPPHHPAPQPDPDLQRQVDEALEGQSLDQLMAEAPEAESIDAAPDSGADDSRATSADGAETKSFHQEIWRGRMVAVRGEDVFVDLFGQTAKLQGVVPLAQFERAPRIGAVMDFVVARIDEGEGLVYLSREGTVSGATWEQLQRGAVVEARVVSTNRGGLELEMIGGIRAFMPASQIDLHHVKDLEAFVGEKLEGLVQEIDRRSRKVVLSRRQHLQHQREQAKRQLLAELEEGQVREGIVRRTTHFGAFVDLGGLDGLIHVSDLTYGHVDQPGDVVKVGQTVKVKVLKINTENGRIGLGLKQVQPDPWDGLSERLRMGDQVVARVIRTTPFGAFAEVEAGIEGLVPISEMSWKRIRTPEEVVEVGQVLSMVVIGLDPAKRRLSLSLKQTHGDPWVGAERKYEKNSLLDGKVLGTTHFGAFVELEPGLEGLVHISELSNDRVGSVQDVVTVGTTKQFRVLEVDEQQRRIRLSLKTTTAPPSPTDVTKPQRAAARKPPKHLKGGTGVRTIDLANLTLDNLK